MIEWYTSLERGIRHPASPWLIGAIFVPVGIINLGLSAYFLLFASRTATEYELPGYRIGGIICLGMGLLIVGLGVAHLAMHNRRKKGKSNGKTGNPRNKS